MRFTKRTSVKVDLRAIEHNVDALTGGLPAGVRKCLVVKADAYGHGAVKIAERLKDRADFLAVACAAEAMQLREAGIRLPILILGYSWKEDYAEMISNRIRMTVFKEEDAVEISKAAAAQRRNAVIHIKLDTGMHRIGFAPTQETVDAVRRIQMLPGVCVEGIFTHFARADETDLTFTRQQHEIFDDIVHRIEDGGKYIPIKHTANSAGTIRFQEYCPDMARLGIALYGIYPSDEVERDVKLEPALSWESEVVYITDRKAGEGISYNHIRVLDSDRRVATIPVGYADGYPRLLSDKACVLINGKRAPILGRICMDQMMADVTDIPDVKEGDRVVLLGRSGEECISVEELSAICGRFPYEFLCDIGERVPRIYVH